jgi:3-oxoacyl-[acyl-carrier protein] reductase
VTINNLLPGKFDTDRIAVTLKGASEKTGQPVEELRRQQQAQIPAGRYGRPQEFGAICAFLCSQQAAYMTGQNVLADGGAYPGTF